MTDLTLGDVVSWNGNTWGVEGSFSESLPAGTLGVIVGLTDLSTVPQFLRDLLAEASGGLDVIDEKNHLGLTVRWEGDWGESPATPREVTKVEADTAGLESLLG